MRAYKLSAKITTHIPEQLAQRLAEAFAALPHLRRDEYLTLFLKQEISRLKEAQSDFANWQPSGRNSAAAKKYVAAALNRFVRKPIQISIDQELADQLQCIVDKGNIVRDALLTRFFLLFLLPEEIFRPFGVAAEVNTIEGLDHGNLDAPFIPLSPMVRERDVVANSMLELHEHFKMITGLPNAYATRGIGTEAHEVLRATECFMPDVNVPGTHTRKKLDKSLKDPNFLESLINATCLPKE